MSKLNHINKFFSLLFLVLFVSACSSTAEQANKSIYTNKFSVEKKSFYSDRELLFSLLNRPLPEDQQMMLGFAHDQDTLASQYPQVSYVSIRGDRQNDKRNVEQIYAYSDLIYQDQNSVFIGAPR
ncbi:MAG: hypothetical protein JKX78_09475 [Alteromonadaceae bacterium]|nr:hypothetical protein [Alteromonadaceae bacterium]